MAASPNPTGADLGEELGRLVRAVTAVDGVSPFNEATMLNLAARRAEVIRNESGELVALALSHPLENGTIEAELAVTPTERGAGLGRQLIERIRQLGPSVFWAHGDLPHARELAKATGLYASRRLFVLARPLSDADLQAPVLPSTVRIRPFSPQRDAARWVTLNAKIFADHPEQGSVTLADLADRMAQPWFSVNNFLVLEQETGQMLGYNWLKVTDDEAEIYVVGVSPQSSGAGFGRALMTAGLARLRQTGADTAVLYVDGENDRALNLYRRLGFTERAVDAQYR